MPPTPEKGFRTPALGRSRGGLTSRNHLACGGAGRPLALTVTGGNINNCTQVTAVMTAIRVPRTDPGRPRVRPSHVLDDKGYSSPAIRNRLRRRGMSHTIPGRADRVRNRLNRDSRGGRPPALDRDAYRRRNVAERCFTRLKQWCGIATRYDKTTESSQAAVAILAEAVRRDQSQGTAPLRLGPGHRHRPSARPPPSPRAPQPPHRRTRLPPLLLDHPHHLADPGQDRRTQVDRRGNLPDPQGPGWTGRMPGQAGPPGIDGSPSLCSCTLSSPRSPHSNAISISRPTT